jgi:hypothetical protein
MADLITIEEAKRYLGFPDKDDKDEELADVIAGVSEAVRSETGRDFALAGTAYTEHKNGNETRALRVLQPPMLSAATTTVRENGTLLVVASGYSTSAGVVVDLPNGILYRQSGTSDTIGGSRIPSTWAKGKQNIEVVYQSAWTAVPADIKALCRYAVGFEWNMADRKVIGIQSRSSGQSNTSFLEELPKHFRRTLDRYKLAFMAA